MSQLKIYTSYFAKSRKLRLRGVEIISVALSTPRWLGVVRNLHEVAPPAWLIAIGKRGQHADYSESYEKQLDALQAKDVLNHIERIAAEAGRDEVALCCYESPTDFCHRHLLAAWLNEHTNTKIKELIL